MLRERPVAGAPSCLSGLLVWEPSQNHAAAVPLWPARHTLLFCVAPPQVVAYYIEQSKANNHAVREAACACIAELMCKVGAGSFQRSF